MTSPDLTVQDVIDDLGSFYCHNVVASLWADALANRLEATQQPWPWPDTMDALLAAPASHHVLLDNGRVRVLEVVIEPGAREPEHTHRAPSVMMLDEPARIRYYAGGTPRFESQAPPGNSAGHLLDQPDVAVRVLLRAFAVKDPPRLRWSMGNYLRPARVTGHLRNA
jgi:hypothetical protein